MSPNNNEVQSLQLPPPVIEQVPAIPANEAPKGAERASQPEQVAQSAPIAAPTIPLPLPPTMPIDDTQPPVTSTITQDNPLQASDDTDLIEKEWVNKAKQIVERNKDNPYKQSEELTVFKADYMKKRYNKTIKLNK